MVQDAIERRLGELTERVAALEVKVANNTKAESDLTERIDKLDVSIKELVAVLNQAKGARWAVLFLAAGAGAGVVEFVQRIFGMTPPGSGAP